LLDRLWEIFSGRQADAHLQLLVAARTDDELRRHLVEFDRRVARTLSDAAARVAPDLVRREDFRPLMNTAIATIRGLRLLRAVTSERQVRAQWPAARDQLLGARPAPWRQDGDVSADREIRLGTAGSDRRSTGKPSLG
jgi:hypothetical protein